MAFTPETHYPMKTNGMLVIGLAAIAAAVCAQTVSNVTHLPHTWVSKVDGASYVASLEREAVVAAPSWDPAKPLPMSFSKAEQIARRELRKLVKDEPAWEVESFQLHRLKHTPYWYYNVEFRPPPANGHKETYYANILVDASGKPGAIEKAQSE